MKIFTVHQPPDRWRETRRGPERFAFVRDGFHFWAFLLGPLWMLWRRLLLVLLGYVVILIALNVALFFLQARGGASFATHFLLACLVGLEAPTLRRWTLRRRGWSEVGVVTAEDQEAAERRFFDRWTQEGAAAAPPPAAPASSGYGAQAFVRRPTASPEVIGLFPEPGASR